MTFKDIYDDYVKFHGSANMPQSNKELKYLQDLIYLNGGRSITTCIIDEDTALAKFLNKLQTCDKNSDFVPVTTFEKDLISLINISKLFIYKNIDSLLDIKTDEEYEKTSFNDRWKNYHCGIQTGTSLLAQIISTQSI